MFLINPMVKVRMKLMSKEKTERNNQKAIIFMRTSLTTLGSGKNLSMPHEKKNNTY